MESRPCKKMKTNASIGESSSSRSPQEILQEYVSNSDWEGAKACVKQHPEAAAGGEDPSPLAVACRKGAPVDCVKAILEACPLRLRRVVDSRGTPLHEAIVCANVGADVIECLLAADEELGTSSAPAAVLQDVDGFTPLHLLIRRRFQSDILRDDGLMEILEILVKSYPQAVIVPDRGEYEEPPIVYALKANIYAPLLGSEDAMTARVERRIYEMVNCMLQHYPSAASCVFAGYRGKYTALHSAVFHGRSPATIELILKAETKSPATTKAALLANTQGEMPLHFSTMRGESPRTVELIANAAPEVTLLREASGLMPMHWLWIRYISTLQALEDGDRLRDFSVTLQMPRDAILQSLSDYNEFSSLEQGDFESDLLILRRLDPSVDFLRMRHIPHEILSEDNSLHWAARTVEILSHVRSRYHEHKREGAQQVVWARVEAVASLFWTKLVSLLRASTRATVKQQQVQRQEPTNEVGDVQEQPLTHMAFESLCCLPALARIVGTLFPNEMMQVDSEGRLPLHCAASRPGHNLQWPSFEPRNSTATCPLFQVEGLMVLRTAMDLSEDRAAGVADKKNRLTLHYAIDNFIESSRSRLGSQVDRLNKETLCLLKALVRMHPESIQTRDGISKLYPYLQAAALRPDSSTSETPKHAHELQLSITFVLLRENPSLLRISSGASEATQR